MSQVEKWIEVDAPLESVFALFSGLPSFSRWMSGVQQVELLAPRRTRWTAQTAAGQSVAWEAETTVFEPNHRLAWRAVTGPVTYEFDATFEATKRGTTLIRILLNEDEAASTHADGPGSFAARLEADLARFKLFAQRDAQEDAQPLPETAAPDTPRFAPVRAHKVVRPMLMATDLPPIQPPRRARPLATAHAADFATPPAQARSEVDLRNAQASPTRDRQNVIPIAGRQTATAPAALPRRPQLLYLLLGLLLFGAVWFFLNHRSSRDAATRTGTSGNTAAVPTVPSTLSTLSDAAAVRENTRATDATAGVPASPVVTGRTAVLADGRSVDARASVIGAINEWVAATNARDVDRQMSFYAPVVQRYYLQSYVSHNAVRADKQQRLGNADAVRISVDEPQITWEQKGRVAHVRFRKQYEIESRGRVERGAVLQQMFWSQGDGQWHIFSERDLRVLR